MMQSNNTNNKQMWRFNIRHIKLFITTVISGACLCLSFSAQADFHNALDAYIARALLKQPKVLIFDEAVSNLDQQTAEHFAQTVNKLKGKVTILFITHQLPKGLQVDEAVILGKDNVEHALFKSGEAGL